MIIHALMLKGLLDGDYMARYQVCGVRKYAAGATIATQDTSLDVLPL